MMPEFVHHHEVVFMLVVCVLVGVSVWHYEKWKDRKALDTPVEPFRPVGYIWQFVAYQGAGGTWSPESQTEEQAIEWCARNLGAVAWVDRQHFKIFYRSRA